MNRIVLSESDYRIIKQCLENVIFNSMYLPEKHEAQMALHRLERAYNRIYVREKSEDKKDE